MVSARNPQYSAPHRAWQSQRVSLVGWLDGLASGTRHHPAHPTTLRRACDLRVVTLRRIAITDCYKSMTSQPWRIYTE
jgi:hypothetical protein